MLKNLFEIFVKKDNSSLGSLIRRGKPPTIQVCKAIKHGPLSMQIRAHRVRVSIFLLSRDKLAI